MNPKFEYAHTPKPYNPYLVHPQKPHSLVQTTYEGVRHVPSTQEATPYDPAPPRSPYSLIEPAFQVKGKYRNIIPLALGPPSKVVGACVQNYPGVRGLCLGAFPSQWVHVSEPQLGHCLFEAHRGVQIGQTQGCDRPNTHSDLDPSGVLGFYRSQPRLHSQHQSTVEKSSSSCTSYSSYSACPNCSLSQGVGNSVLGQYNGL